MAIENGGLSRRGFLAGVGALGLAGASGVGRAIGASAGFKKIKIGQIGVKHAHARGKMESFRELSDYYEVVGVVEPDAAKWESVKGRRAYKGLKLMTEEQPFNYPGLDAVAVETPKRELVATGMRCAKAGMHIHLDKPAGEKLSEFKALLDEMERQKLALQMGYMFRNNPGFQLCFEAAAKGWLGNIFEIHGTMSKTSGKAKRDALSAYPGGTMFELGCHLIDAVVAIMGEPDKVTSFGRQTKPNHDTLWDNQLAVFEYKYAIATIRAALVEVDGAKRRQFVVCGDEGTIDIRPLEAPKVLVTFTENRGKYKKGYQEVIMPKMTGRYDDLLIDFAKVIRGEKENAYPVSHDLAVQDAVLRASGLKVD